MEAIERQRRGRKRDPNGTPSVEVLNDKEFRQLDPLSRSAEFTKVFRSASMPQKKGSSQRGLTPKQKSIADSIGSDKPIGISSQKKKPPLPALSPRLMVTAPHPTLQEPTLSPKEGESDKLNRTVTFSTENSYFVEDECRKYPLIRNAMLEIAPHFQWKQLSDLKDYARQIVSLLRVELENRRVKVELRPDKPESWIIACSAIQKYEELYLV
jgi:hypothetical protein